MYRGKTCGGAGTPNCASREPTRPVRGRGGCRVSPRRSLVRSSSRRAWPVVLRRGGRCHSTGSRHAQLRRSHAEHAGRCAGATSPGDSLSVSRRLSRLQDSYPDSRHCSRPSKARVMEDQPGVAALVSEPVSQLLVAGIDDCASDFSLPASLPSRSCPRRTTPWSGSRRPARPPCRSRPKCPRRQPVGGIPYRHRTQTRLDALLASNVTVPFDEWISRHTTLSWRYQVKRESSKNDISQFGVGVN